MIPIIQLLDGQVVSLERGDLDRPTVWHVDPVEKAQAFVAEGAERLHVTDLDAVAGTGSNAAIVEEIIRRAGVPVQVSGGIRTDEQVKRWIDHGAGRVVLGTAAVRFPDWVKAWAKAHPDWLSVSIDVMHGKVMVDGWRDAAMFAPEDLIHAYDGVPLAAIIVTDIDRDLELPDASFALTARLAEATRTPVVASGLVKTLDDVSTLRYMPAVAGAMVGRPLYDRSFTLAEAIEIARPAPERKAEFV